MNGFVEINSSLVNVAHIIRIYEYIDRQYNSTGPVDVTLVRIELTTSNQRLDQPGYTVTLPLVHTKEELLEYINKSLAGQQFNKKFNDFVREEKC